MSQTNGKAVHSTSTPQFPGFRSLKANFTPTPNDFFDVVLGRYPLRVVTVVGILIRATLGWEDELTGEKRVEAELPLSSFIRPELSESSAREGLREAIAAGFVVRTADPTNKSGGRYALRRADEDALRAAVEKQRRANGDTRAYSGGVKSRPPKSTPLNSGGPNSKPPIVEKETLSVKESVIYNVSEKSLNVTQIDLARLFGQTFNAEERELYTKLVLEPVREVVVLTEDSKSRMRFVQLREICLKNESVAAWSAAVVSLQRRLLSRTLGKLGKPGAYFNTVCMRELEKRGVTVPMKSEEPDREAVRSLITESLAGNTGSESSVQSAPEINSTPAPRPKEITSVSDAKGQTDLSAVWHSVLSSIQETMRTATYESHFKRLRLLSLSGDVATVEAPSAFTKSWIETRHKTVLKSAIAGVVGRPVTVELTIQNN